MPEEKRSCSLQTYLLTIIKAAGDFIFAPQYFFENVQFVFSNSFKSSHQKWL